MKDYTTILILIIILSSMIFGFCISSLINIQKEEHPLRLFPSENNCSSLSIIPRVQCLRDELSSFYKYNISNANKTLSIEQLKTEGGVCDHYAKWYISQFNDSDTYTQEIDMLVGYENTTEFGYALIGHSIAIVSNLEGYCILDQLSVRCKEFK